MVRRVILGLVAAVVLVAGVAAGAAAVWAFMVFGSAGVLRFDAGTIVPGSGAAATIVDVDRFEATVPYVGALGETALSVTTGERGDPSDTLFMGAGPTPRVDEYLKGVPYSVALRDGTTWQVRDVPGVVAPAPPGEQTWWLAQDVGRRPSVAVAVGTATDAGADAPVRGAQR